MAEFEIRSATMADRPAILDLMRSSLQWRPSDPNDALFRWKHDDNAFGPSPAWVAVGARDGGVIGFRTFMRWRFLRDGVPVEAVRAVDTATDPNFQKRGIFRALTLHGLEQLRGSVELVFNTPNSQSRPGYLSMGWREIGAVPTWVRPLSVTSVPRLLRSRGPAERWSEDCSIGFAPSDAFADDAEVTKALGSQSERRGLSTDRSVGYLRWRYGLDELAYRVMPADGGIEDGFVVFRLRRRQRAVEVVVAELFASSHRERAALLTRLTSLARSMRPSPDYLIGLGSADVRHRAFSLPGGGPILTSRALPDEHTVPPAEGWHLSLGDIELM